MKSKYQYIGVQPSSIRIKENGYWGINELDGTQILPSNFIEVFTLASGTGLIAARKDRFWDIYDRKGNVVSTEKYDFIYPFYGVFGMTKVKIGEKWGVINRYGHKILPTIYSKIEKFGKGLVLNKDNSKEYIDFVDLVQLPEIHPLLGEKIEPKEKIRQMYKSHLVKKEKSIK